MEKPLTTIERHQAIIQILQEETRVKVTELAERLDVSEGTIRNDLIALDNTHLIRRVRGGAVAKHAVVAPSSSIAARAQINFDAKYRIAQWAAGMIENGDVILMDASTTVLHVASFLMDRSHLTVVTNGLEVARLLAANPTNTVIILGGILRPDGDAVTGNLSEKILQDLYIHSAFVSCAGLSIEAGLMETTLQEAQIKSLMINSAKRTIALVDSSKFEKTSLTPFANLNQISYLATDNLTPISIIDEICEAGTNVIVCGEETVSSYTPSRAMTQHYRIGFANLSENVAFGRDVRRGLEQAAQAYSHIELLIADNQHSREVALTVVDSLIEQEVDLAIEFQIHESAGNLIISKFNKAGIPVIAVDIPMVGATFFGVDNYRAGHMGGRALGEAVQSQWQGVMDYLIVLEHPRAGHLPAARMQGQLDGLQEILGNIPESKIAYLDCGNMSEISEAAALELLEKLPDALRLAVICFNDEAAIGVLNAADKLGRSDDYLITSQGADRRIREYIRAGDKRIVGSTAYKPELYGEKLLAIALQILEGKPTPPAVYMEHTFITAKNIDQHYPHAEDLRR
jgi:ribose transport system substrate-binding protein